MSTSKITSVAITAITALVLSSGFAVAESYDTSHRTMISSSVPDNNAPTSSLSAREFFERLQNNS